MGNKKLYTDRTSKQQFVYNRFKRYLKDSILDVGAGKGHLKDHLPSEVSYTGIGLPNNNPDIVHVDLEKQKIPFDNMEFECVLALDVLEHLDNIHEVFYECCRVSGKWLIVSLPNNWANYFAFLKTSSKQRKTMKFYGLPTEKVLDRHKWFFSSSEAEVFLRDMSKKSGFEICELFMENDRKRSKFFLNSKIISFNLLKLFRFIRRDVSVNDIYGGTLWCVLKRSK
jgi:2-polyprenyl-3-methyl-5-hydroxy-6-metoxy-1,4-benzoquinol methylase